MLRFRGGRRLSDVVGGQLKAQAGEERGGRWVRGSAAGRYVHIQGKRRARMRWGRTLACICADAVAISCGEVARS